jgi:hypothetical protein
MDAKEYVLARKRGKTYKRLNAPPGEEKERARSGRGNAYQHVKTGYRDDIGISARSNWEANLARVLTVHRIKWEFEPRLFTFPIKRGNRTYLPDFYLPDTDEWVEVKGYLDPNSKMKLKRFKKFEPEEWAKLTMVISRGSRKAREFCEELEVPNVIYYEELAKAFKDLIGKNWQGR